MNYFELYYAYLSQCEKENWANMRDPNHDYMEWNHTLPQCIFGDQPIGQWLTIEQHAIVSALQTLAFNRNCLMGFHLPKLPKNLRELVQPVFNEFAKNNMYRGNAPGSPTLSLEMLEFFADARMRGLEKCWKKPGPRAGHVIGKQNRELERGIFDPSNKEKVTEGRSRGGVKGARKVNSQVWESTRDGFRSTPGNVAQHNKANGWSPDDRIRVK